MRQRKSNLGRRTRRAEAVRRVIANQTEEERASANERKRQRMSQIRAEESKEQRAARLEDARLRARRLRSAASDLLRSQQNERDRLRIAERRQRETADKRQAQPRAQQSYDYNNVAFRSFSLNQNIQKNAVLVVKVLTDKGGMVGRGMDSLENKNKEVQAFAKKKVDSKKNGETNFKCENEIQSKPAPNEAEIIDLDDYGDEGADISKNKEADIKNTLEPESFDFRSTEAKEKNSDLITNLQTKNINSDIELTNESQDEIETPEKMQKIEKFNNLIQDNEKKNQSSLVDNQVQCVNLHCQSGYDLAEAPVFVLTYFRATRRKNLLQKVCRECFNIALKHQEKLCNMLVNKIPLMSADFPSQKDDVVVMDSVEEIFEEEILPQSVISLVEKELANLLKNAVNEFNLNFQVEKCQEILSKKYDELIACNKEINAELNSIEDQLKETRALIYKKFTPRIRNLPPLNVIEARGYPETKITPPPRSRCVATKKVTQMCASPSKLPSLPPQNSESHDVVALKEVEVRQVKLPPIGTLIYPMLFVGSPIFVMKVSFFGVWVKARIVEILPRNEGQIAYRVRFESSYHGGYKTVTGKQIAYSKASSVRYSVGTRVIALFHNADSPGKDAYYAGVIAEPPKILNIFRYLVFFDDGYAQYVSHEKIHLVCEASKFVHEDIHPDSREFIKNYLNQYPERPMVKLQKGQVLKTEWNGKWWVARVVAIDGSLAKMHFEADNRTEWIYRGSTRLGPLYSELIAAAARKEQGALSRHRSLGIASLKKRNMPYVEYNVDQDDTKSQQPAAVSKNVAKKSTASKLNFQDSGQCTGPPKPNEKMEHTTKGYIRTMDLTGRIKGRAFTPHQCGLSCIEWTKYCPGDCKGTNPLAIPLFYGFERQITQYKGKKFIMYCAPCGRRLRNIVEMHRYLRITKSAMGLDLFDFDPWVRVLDEFHLEPNMYCTHIKDLSYGHENTPVSCVNEINHSWPSFMNYSTCRIPQEGVNICLDEEFLVCCSCTDDCQDKDKCQCWQLTIEGTKLAPGGQIDPTVGYQYKRLPEPAPTGIYECNQRCKCGPTCLNRIAQHPLQLNLQVFRTLKKGWGLRTLNDIPQGGFICIYAGRLHTEQSANDDGRMYGDEYLAELDYIEVIERFKEGYESDVIEPGTEKKNGENVEEENDDGEGNEDEEEDELDESQMNSDDTDYVPQGLSRLPNTDNVVNTRGRNRKINSEEKSESEGEKEKEEETENEKDCLNADDDDDDADDGGDDDDDDDDGEMKKKPSKFTAEVPVEDEKPPKHKSVREMFGDGADDCYIMDAKSSGNIGRYLNHSCQPNVFVQNVFVDTHDVRFPWVAFFALTYIKAGTELTWDYNYDIGSVPGKVLYCYCNSAECRGRLL